MKLKILGSSSAGNCYVLQPEKGAALVLEAGVTAQNLGKAVTFRWSEIAGVFITHEHQDHAAHVKDYQRRGLKVYATTGTAEKLENQNILRIDENPTKKLKVGDFTIIWFDTIHDAAQPCGYYINHPEMGNLLFVTDTGEINKRFTGINHLLIETNYDPDNKAFNDLTKSYIERVRLSHLSIKQAENFIIENCAVKDLFNVVLIHLSSRHADKKEFKKRIETVCRNNAIGAKVHIATPWLCVNLNDYKNLSF